MPPASGRTGRRATKRSAAAARPRRRLAQARPRLHRPAQARLRLHRLRRAALVWGRLRPHRLQTPAPALQRSLRQRHRHRALASYKTQRQPLSDQRPGQARPQLLRLRRRKRPWSSRQRSCRCCRCERCASCWRRAAFQRTAASRKSTWWTGCLPENETSENHNAGSIVYARTLARTISMLCCDAYKCALHVITAGQLHSEGILSSRDSVVRRVLHYIP